VRKDKKVDGKEISRIVGLKRDKLKREREK
jgi:hypothetical protein